MKRKVIQIAGSTQLVSLPRQWAKAHNIQRGQEIDVQEDGDNIIVHSSNAPLVEKAEIDISQMSDMTARCIRSLYKRGVDELRVTFSNPDTATLVQNAIAKEAVGFEILEQGQTYCLIKYVSGAIEEFDQLLRRIFLLLVNMADDSETEKDREHVWLIHPSGNKMHPLRQQHERVHPLLLLRSQQAI